MIQKSYMLPDHSIVEDAFRFSDKITRLGVFLTSYLAGDTILNLKKNHILICHSHNVAIDIKTLYQ